jgi:hypothetical protein
MLEPRSAKPECPDSKAAGFRENFLINPIPFRCIITIIKVSSGIVRNTDYFNR